MALGSTQPIVKMSTRSIPGGKGGRCVSLTSPPSRAECHEIWEPKPPGSLWATPGLLGNSFTFTFTMSLGDWSAFLFAWIDEQNAVVADYIDQTELGSNPTRSMDMLGDFVF
jgi:hypothetical protein